VDRASKGSPTPDDFSQWSTGTELSSMQAAGSFVALAGCGGKITRKKFLTVCFQNDYNRGNMMKETKSVTIITRIPPSEKARLQAACKEMDIKESDFIRACINRELAMNLDPKAIEALANTFRKGMQEVVHKLVDEGIEAAKKREAKRK
jgi:hypothetical protein